MTEARLTLTTEGDTRVIVTRRFAAAPATVFRAHVDPEIVPRWLTGPEGWSMPVCISEAWPGGRLRCEWVDGAGAGFHLTGEYLEVEPPHRILHVERMHLPEATPDNRVETRFLPDGAGTRLVMTMTLPDAAALAAMLATGMEEGMEASYARLDAMAGGGFRMVAEGAQSLVCTRCFAAAPAAVQRAHLDPALVPRWMGGGAYPMTEARIDAREGGTFRYLWAAPGGQSFALAGRFVAIAPGRIEHVEQFTPDWTGGETRVVTTFQADGAGTVLRMEVIYSSPAARDGAARTGMASGMEGAYDRLAALI